MKIKELADAIQSMIREADAQRIRITHLTITRRALEEVKQDADLFYSASVVEAMSGMEFFGIPMVMKETQDFVLMPHYETWRNNIVKFDPEMPMPSHGNLGKGLPWKPGPYVLESSGRVRMPGRAAA